MSIEATPTADAASSMLAALNGSSAPTTPAAQPAATPAATPAGQAPAAPAENAVQRALKSAKMERDFAGLPDDIKPLFEQMSNEAFARLSTDYRDYLKLKPHADKLTKVEQLEADLAESRNYSYADHPEAYQLSTEYSALTSRLERVAQVEDVFERAAATVANPAATSVEIVVNEGGQLGIKSVPITDEVRRTVMREYNEAVSVRKRLEGEAAQLKTSHGQRHKNYTESLAKVETQLFGPYKEALGTAAEEHLAKMPAYLRGRPEGRLLANAVALLDKIGPVLERLQAQANGKAAHTQAVAGAPPGRDMLPAAPAGSAKAYSDDEFKKLAASGMLPN